MSSQMQSLKYLFLTISNIDIDFKAQNLHQRFYSTKKISAITRKVELIKKKKFAVIALHQNHKTFMIHVVAFNISSNIGDEIYLLQNAQIAYLKMDKASTKVFHEYAHFAYVFSLKLTGKSPNTWV